MRSRLTPARAGYAVFVVVATLRNLGEPTGGSMPPMKRAKPQTLRRLRSLTTNPNR